MRASFPPFVLVIAAACGASPAPLEAKPASAAVTSATAPTDSEAVSVEVHAPSRVRYERSALGAERPRVVIAVTNADAGVDAGSVDVSGLRLTVTAVREGVLFRCADDAGPPPGAREPSSVAPRSTATFERDLDCALPLVGTYAVRVAVSFGHAAWSQPRVVKSFVLVVTAPPNAEPRAVAAVPGLWAAVGASGVLFGGSGQHGKVGLALVNAGAGPIELPPLRLRLRVYRAGGSIACEDAPHSVAAPAALGAGAVHRQPLEVPCLNLELPGDYEVEARLIAPGGESPIGRLGVHVASEPSLVVAPLRP